MHISKWLVIVTSTVCAAAFAEQEAVRQGGPVRTSTREVQNPEWVSALERIRVQPRAGEVKNIGVTLGIADLFNLNPDEKAGLTKIQEEYEAALIERAAKWEEEQKAMRAEYEQKIIQALPQAKQDEAKKVLELSHSQWAGELDRDRKLNKEVLERARAQQQAQQSSSVEEVRQGRQQMTTWIKDQRTKLVEQNELDLKALKALMTPDEAARLDLANRNRAVPPPAAPQK